MNSDINDSCTIAGATGTSTTDGLPIIGSNSDDPFTTRTRLVVVDPPKGNKFIGTQIISENADYVASFDRMHTRGINERGFAYTWAAVRPNPEIEPDSSCAFGIPFYQFGDLLLSQSATVSDAIGLLESNPRAIHGNYLFGDADGNIALVEVSTLSLHVETLTNDGWIGRSNHWISSTMSKIGNPGKPEDSTSVRFARISTLMEEGSKNISARYLAKCFSDHLTLDETGWSICAHGHNKYPTNGTRGGTVSSEIMQPTLRTMNYNYGWPCGSPNDYPEGQMYQDRSWGTYLTFPLDDLDPGEYVTLDGRLTALAIKYLSQAGANNLSLT